MPIVARAGRAVLRDYGDPGRPGGRPVIVIPSLINGADILDLLPDLSLLRWLGARGVRPLLVDWGTPEPDERDLSIAGHVETMLLPLVDAIGSHAVLSGYCLGGTMAIAAAALRPVAGLVLIAAPWDFGGFPENARIGLRDLWAAALPTAEAIGLLPLEVLQAAFWQIDPERTVAKFEAFGRQPRDARDTELFVALEDWANDGPPLTLAAGRELSEDLFGANLTGSGRWRVGGRAIDLAALACPVLDIVSTSDRIVPAVSAAGPAIAGSQRLELALGHVGMMVGGRARTALWEPLADWLANRHIAG